MLPSNYNLLHLPEVDSTNEFAKKLILEQSFKGHHIIVADHQTKGKGRLGRAWESPKSEGLWMSIVLGSPVVHGELVTYNFLASVGVCETLRALSGKKFELKWPNDVLIDGKKICGILLETVSKGNELFLIAGIGVNINQKKFPEYLQDTATSLYMETQSEYDLTLIMEEIVARFEKYKSLPLSDILKLWKNLTGMIGRRIRVMQNDKTFEATTVDIAEDGALVIDHDGIVEKIYAGDVQIRLDQ